MTSRQSSQPNAGNPLAAAHLKKLRDLQTAKAAKKLADAAATETLEAAKKTAVVQASPTLVSRITTLLLDKRFLLSAALAVSAAVYYKKFGFALPWETKKKPEATDQTASAKEEGKPQDQMKKVASAEAVLVDAPTKEDEAAESRRRSQHPQPTAANSSWLPSMTGISNFIWGSKKPATDAQQSAAVPTAPTL